MVEMCLQMLFVCLEGGLNMEYVLGAKIKIPVWQSNS